MLKWQYIKTGNRLLETSYRYHYRRDVIIRGRPPDLGLCYSDVTGQLAQKFCCQVYT